MPEFTPESLALLKRWQEGDQDAGDQFIRLRGLQEFAAALAQKFAYTTGRPDRWDMVGDLGAAILMKVFRVIGTYDPDRPFGPWFVAVAYNAMRDEARRWRRVEGPLQSLDEPFPTEDGTPGDEGEGPSLKDTLEATGHVLDDTLQGKLVRTLVHESIMGIWRSDDDPHWVAFSLRYGLGCSQKEGAWLMGDSEVNFRSNVFRGGKNVGGWLKARHLSDDMIEAICAALEGGHLLIDPALLEKAGKGVREAWDLFVGADKAEKPFPAKEIGRLLGVSARQAAPTLLARLVTILKMPPSVRGRVHRQVRQLGAAAALVRTAFAPPLLVSPRWTLGLLVTRACRKLGIALADLSNRAGLPGETVDRILADRPSPKDRDPGALSKLAVLLRLPADILAEAAYRSVATPVPVRGARKNLPDVIYQRFLQRLGRA